MTQFEQPFDQPETGPAQTSPLAIIALVCSLIFFCPITTILGPILGIVAMIGVGSDPQKKGKGLAVTAIVLGVVFTAGQGYFGYRIGKFGMDIVRYMMQAPNAALTAGFDGDMQGFKDEFHGRGATLSDQQAQQFIDTLRERYGEFQTVNFPQQQAQQPAPGQTTAVMPYQLQFSNVTVDAEVELILADPNTGQFIKKLGYILIKDEERDNVRYPPQTDGGDGEANDSGTGNNGT